MIYENEPETVEVDTVPETASVPDTSVSTEPIESAQPTLAAVSAAAEEPTAPAPTLPEWAYNDWDGTDDAVPEIYRPMVGHLRGHFTAPMDERIGRLTQQIEALRLGGDDTAAADLRSQLDALQAEKGGWTTEKESFTTRQAELEQLVLQREEQLQGFLYEDFSRRYPAIMEHEKARHDLADLLERSALEPGEAAEVVAARHGLRIDKPVATTAQRLTAGAEEPVRHGAGVDVPKTLSFEEKRRAVLDKNFGG